MGERYISLRELLDLLRRQSGVIAITLLIVLAAAGLLILLLKPTYTATNLVLVDPSHKDLLSPDGQWAGRASDASRVDNEVELVKSQSTLLSVVDAADLVHDPEFGPQLGIRERLLQAVHFGQPGPASGENAWNEVVDRLSDATSVQRRGTTSLIEINVRSANPELAARLANAIADSYIRDQRDAKIASVLSSRDIVQGRIADAGAAVVNSEEAADDFVTANLDKISAETGRTDLAAIRKQIEALASGQRALQAQADAAGDHLSRRDWKGLADSLQLQTIASLDQQQAQIVGELSGLSASTQRAIDLRAELTKIQADLIAAADAALSSLRQQISDDRAKASDFKLALRTSVVNSDLPATQLAALYEMQQNSQIARVQYQALLARQKDLEAQAYLQIADSRVVSPATPPTTPSSPNSRLILVLGGIAGLALGVAISMARESLGSGFHSAEQAETLLRYPVVASIPQQKHGASSLADLLVDAPLSHYSDAIRRLQVGIDQALKRQRKRYGEGQGAVVMITSAAPGEGKTTIALSLARALVDSGRTALLIDGDLRQPRLHDHLGLQPSTGLSEYLLNKAGSPEITDIVVDDPASGASVILGARRKDLPAGNRFASEALQRLLAEARRNFDVVILDTPPIGPVIDGIYLAESADIIVFVLRSAGTTQADARTALAALAEAKSEPAEILVVINQDRRTQPRRHASYKRYYEDA
jgi:succinoglycan biosynthesis transport protein ExoP